VIRKWYNNTRKNFRAYRKALHVIAFDSASLDELQDFYLWRNTKDDLAELEMKYYKKFNELYDLEVKLAQKENRLAQL